MDGVAYRVNGRAVTAVQKSEKPAPREVWTQKPIAQRQVDTRKAINPDPKADLGAVNSAEENVLGESLQQLLTMYREERDAYVGALQEKNENLQAEVVKYKSRCAEMKAQVEEVTMTLHGRTMIGRRNPVPVPFDREVDLVGLI